MTVADAKPLILIVEDRPRLRKLRARLFDQLGGTAIGADSYRAALREIKAAPGVNLVLADIQLSEVDESDRSGIDVARHVKELRPDVPVAGYTANVPEQDLSLEERAVFDRTYTKGMQDIAEIRASLEECLALANAHRQRRNDEHDALLARLRREAEARAPEHEMLRRLVPDPSAQAEVEGRLREAGYRLKLVQSKAFADLASPFILWVVDQGDHIAVEVYGHPALYAYGETEESAVESLFELMEFLADDFGSDAEPMAGEASDVRAFLLDRLSRSPR